MTYLIIYRSTYTVRISLIIKRCRNTTHFCCHIINDLIDLCCIHSLMNMLLNIIKHCNIDLAALLNPCNLICILPGEAGIIPLNAVTPVLGAPVIIYVIVNQRKIQYFN